MHELADAPGYERRYVLFFALFCAFAAIVPDLFALIAAPAGSSYIGTSWATDDYMVYAAWAKQAAEGSFLFDNRFTPDPQPGLTINLYFLALGQIARITGIPVAFALAKFVLSFAFVWLAYRLVRRITEDTYTIKVALTFIVFGAGVGFLVWQRYGLLISLERPAALTSLMKGYLPVDVWQPEGFVFPSMLTTSLFMAALCLIVFVFLCFLDARESWKAVWPGFAGMFVLMNIHSYDVLLVALVMAGFLVMAVARKQVTVDWITRSAVIAAGAIPPALWFMHVLRSDAVFQARAATDTQTGNFTQIFFGYLILLGLGVLWMALEGAKRRSLGWIPGAATGALLLALYLVSSTHEPDTYWLSAGLWLALYAVVLGLLWLLASAKPAANLILAWGLVGIVAPYFPALFQRKLAMGLSVPWAVLAALGFAAVFLRFERGQRNLISILGILLVCGSSALWLQRSMTFVRENISRTTVHSVYLPSDVSRILDYLDDQDGRQVVVAMPGIAAPDGPDRWKLLMPDLNPVVSGFTGAYTYAGHWSETPNYNERRAEQSAFFAANAPEEVRQAFLAKVQPTFIVAPAPEVFQGVADLRAYGQVVVDGSQFDLIRVSR